MSLTMFLTSLGGLFAIMNPFMALPMFLTLTQGMDPRQQRGTALKVVLYTTVFCVLILASGTLALRAFGIDVNDFRAAGGVVLAMIGLGMLNGGSPAHDGSTAEQKQASSSPAGDVAFYPLTFPMLAGPGTITTLILLGGRAHTVTDYVGLAAGLAAIIALLGIVLYFAGSIGEHLSRTVRTIMTRLMGMILTAVGIQMIVTGLKDLLPGLAG